MLQKLRAEANNYDTLKQSLNLALFAENEVMKRREKYKKSFSTIIMIVYSTFLPISDILKHCRPD